MFFRHIYTKFIINKNQELSDWKMAEMIRNIKLLFIVSLFLILTGVNVDVLHAETSAVNGIVNSLFGNNDKAPPDIDIESPSNGQTVYTDKIYIAGQVYDNDSVDTLKINKVPLMNGTGRSVSFSDLVQLSEGKNAITIEALDEAGNTARKEIVVIRKDPPLSRLPKEVVDSRMRLAVYPFEHKGIISEESGIFLDLLTLALQHQERFQLIDRTLMDRILKEQKLSLTQLIDQDTAVKAGRIMSAQAIVTGSIMKTGGGIELIGRMIDTETSEIVATEKIYSDKAGTEGMNFLAQALAAQLHNDFPMIQGVVIERKGREIFTDIGLNKAHQRGRLIIYREKKNGSGKDSIILGYARITQVLKEMSKAELTTGKPEDIKILDRVIVQ